MSSIAPKYDARLDQFVAVRHRGNAVCSFLSATMGFVKSWAWMVITIWVLISLVMMLWQMFWSPQARRKSLENRIRIERRGEYLKKQEELIEQYRADGESAASSAEFARDMARLAIIWFASAVPSLDVQKTMPQGEAERGKASCTNGHAPPQLTTVVETLS